MDHVVLPGSLNDRIRIRGIRNIQLSGTTAEGDAESQRAESQALPEHTQISSSKTRPRMGAGARVTTNLNGVVR